MSDRQNKKYIMTAINGMDIEVIGTRNMKAMAELLTNYKLKIRYVDPKKQNISTDFK